MPSKICQVVVFTAMSLSAPNITLAETAPAPKVTDPHFYLTPGYLQTSDLPDSLVLLGAPPANGSAALARDEAAREATIPLRGKARWDLARTDADLQFPQPAKNFSCAMGVDISEEKTPHIYRLMGRVLTDAGLSTYGVKNKYNRTRPFVVHNEGTCQPDEEDVLRHDGSYPSGHTAAGWAWALTLAEVNPKRTDALLKRGLSFGQSRVICNAHWQSDVDAGRIMAAATVARLHSNPEFLADIQGARNELETASAPVQDCIAENKVLSESEH
ncbi:acid phosphatase [Pseudochrobactrum kiredjianiae]|uniref:Acid phosphatase n=1 Tax=Pseudochrobactrum kiredjianiae TaxID=386305 RepID=A0ABW3UZN9_9HYPH|nr:phosphatase PAP2 family protein [Pseudochrobactrum kiredjianiae]MDM7852788.1 phosphatase PAP2 family protein [Pseudochrobactrum kiredjianiae]